MLHITIDKKDGTEFVREDDEEPLGLIYDLEVGVGRRRAWVAHAPMQHEAQERTRKTLMRYGFDVGLKL